jgi:hypothetical protein
MHTSPRGAAARAQADEAVGELVLVDPNRAAAERPAHDGPIRRATDLASTLTLAEAEVRPRPPPHDDRRRVRPLRVGDSGVGRVERNRIGRTDVDPECPHPSPFPPARPSKYFSR